MPTMFDSADNGRPAANPVIAVQDLSVRFRLPEERVSGLKEFAVRWLQGRIAYRDLWALRGVCFEVRHGEMFGVVGANGSGKSTLLRTLARVLHPTRGRVVVQGAVAPILELGAGFHPELTGRENVFLYGTLLGWTRAEIEAEFDGLVGFAGLEGFVDAPLRTYSAGMTARLAFSVATARPAQVILLDEVLAVGDVEFQARCVRRLQDYRAAGSTIVVVSHDPGVVRSNCSRCLWLDGGSVREIGPAEHVVDRYLQAMVPATAASETNGHGSADGQPVRKQQAGA